MSRSFGYVDGVQVFSTFGAGPPFLYGSLRLRTGLLGRVLGSIFTDDDREDYEDDDEVGEHQKLSVMEPRSELSSMLQGSWHRDRLSLFHALK